MWAVFAFGSAVFAALTSVLAKIGINGVQSNLATAVRTVVVLVMAWGMVFLTDGAGDGVGNGIPDGRAGRHRVCQPQKLAFFGSFRLGNRRVVALLLPGAAAWRSVEGRFH